MEQAPKLSRIGSRHDKDGRPQTKMGWDTLKACAYTSDTEQWLFVNMDTKCATTLACIPHGAYHLRKAQQSSLNGWNVSLDIRSTFFHTPGPQRLSFLIPDSLNYP